LTLALLFLAALVALAWLPQAWVKGVLKSHSAPRPDMPGTGAEFARQALDRLGLMHVKVEPTKAGDHYDPQDKAVRLSPVHYGVRSLAAVVVAAHEVGHAMQDATGYKALSRRTEIARQAHRIERLGSFVMLAAPILLIVMKSPAILLIDYAAGALILVTGILMQAFTLPVELDASFRRALPLLKEGRFIPDADMPAARRILKAAAYTYVASAMMTLLDVMRWLRVLKP
jgi:hypothetical protein